MEASDVEGVEVHSQEGEGDGTESDSTRGGSPLRSTTRKSAVRA